MKLKKTLFLIYIYSFFFININCQEKNFSPDYNLLKESVFTEFNFLPRKEQLFLVKPKNLSLMLDLSSAKKEFFSQVVKTELSEKPLYKVLDSLLDGTDLFYHLDNTLIVVSSEFLWINKEDSFQYEYDISNLYNLKEEMVDLIKNQISLYEFVKCKTNINITNSRTVAIYGNKYMHCQLKLFFEALRKQIHDYTINSTQLIFLANQHFKDKSIDITPIELTSEEWLNIIAKSLDEKLTIKSIEAQHILKETKLKFDTTQIQSNETILKITSLIKFPLYYQKNQGLFFVEDEMKYLTPIQKNIYRVYNIKQFSDKINGQFICQNIKDEIEKEIWSKTQNQITYFKHLEAIIVLCPPHIIPKIDQFFYNLKLKHP